MPLKHLFTFLFQQIPDDRNYYPLLRPSHTGCWDKNHKKSKVFGHKQKKKFTIFKICSEGEKTTLMTVMSTFWYPRKRSKCVGCAASDRAELKLHHGRFRVYFRMLVKTGREFDIICVKLSNDWCWETHCVDVALGGRCDICFAQPVWLVDVCSPQKFGKLYLNNKTGAFFVKSSLKILVWIICNNNTCIQFVKVFRVLTPCR